MSKKQQYSEEEDEQDSMITVIETFVEAYESYADNLKEISDYNVYRGAINNTQAFLSLAESGNKQLIKLALNDAIHSLIEADLILESGAHSQYSKTFGVLSKILIDLLKSNRV